MKVIYLFLHWLISSFFLQFENHLSLFGVNRFKKILLIGMILPYTIFAATESVTDSTSTAINDNSCFEKTFNISLLANTTDVRMEVNLDHTYRGDLQVYLTSPSGTQMTLSENH
jgi:hypothetical protein